MSEMKHTPGPWITADRPQPLGFRLEVEEHKTGRVVAFCQTRGKNQFGIYGDEAFANARLIAAAPDLYEALTEAAQAFRHYERHHAAEAVRLREPGDVQPSQADAAQVREFKAARNRELAEVCEAALSRARGEP